MARSGLDIINGQFQGPQGLATMLMNGESNKGIARGLQIAEATVKVHVKAILRKIQAKNRTQAAMWAANHHWTAPIDSADSPVFSLTDNRHDE